MIPLLLFVSFTGCATISPVPTTPTPEAQSTSTITVSPSEEWKTYTNPEYGFSINYPAYLEINPGVTNDSLYIGEKIQVWISDINPLECRGDCPLVENTELVTVAGLDATKVTGYIGAIGGNIPQRYIRYILPRNNQYYLLTLYALSFRAAGNDPATIWPISENDSALFEQVVGTFRFTN
jgi:hypothetical protein